MNPSAVNINVTIDDWASILNYTNPTEWTTPDPSNPPVASILPTTPWLDGTWHQTSVVNATVSLSFQGPAIYVFGASGPAYGSYAVSIDGSEQTFSAHAASNASLPYLLYGNSSLPYANHTLVLRNLGAAQTSDGGAGAFLLDFILATAQLGPPGANVTNTTVEDNSPLTKYVGSWTTESSPLFSGNTSTYTNSSNASASITFNGSALYIFGDTVNNHGPYTVLLDSGPIQYFNAISGCGGAFGKFCEKTVPSLKYFASNLGPEQHTVTLTNLGINGSFFDLDRFVYTTPSQYAVQTPSTNSTTGSSSSSSSTAHKNSGNHCPHCLLLIGFFWLLRIGRLHTLWL